MAEVLEQAMTSAEMVVTIITSSAFTGAVVEIVREARKIVDRKKNKGLAKIEGDIADIRSQNAQYCSDIKVIKDELLARQETDKVILHDRIWEMFHTLSGEDCVTIEDMANLDYLYEEYTKLHGNHQAEIMYNFIKKMPVKADADYDKTGNLSE